MYQYSEIPFREIDMMNQLNIRAVNGSDLRNSEQE